MALLRIVAIPSVKVGICLPCFWHLSEISATLGKIIPWYPLYPHWKLVLQERAQHCDIRIHVVRGTFVAVRTVVWSRHGNGCKEQHKYKNN